MTTLYVTHEDCLRHETPLGHPERVDRLRAVDRALAAPAFAGLARAEAPLATDAMLHLCHPETHVRALREAAPSEGLAAIDADTVMSPGTLDAALRGVGGAVLAVDRVMGGQARNAFVGTRPPGHHAERATAMGFCLFNQAAIAARPAQTVHGARRVVIVDWDVHHGNGTQDIFWDDPSVMYVSTHQMPLYPGTGGPEERGVHGTVLNLPLAAGDGGEAFRALLDEAALPRMAAFEPDLVIISAGFDAHWRDPLGQLNLTEADFAWATRRLMALAGARAGGRLVSVLEGGYDLEGLAASVAAHVAALMEP